MRDYKVNKFGAIVPSYVTRSFQYFASEILHRDLFLVFIMLSEVNIEDARKRLIDLYSEPGNELSEALVEYLKNADLKSFFDCRVYEGYYGEMAFARIIDNFMTYFKDLLAEVITKHPNILKSRDQEKLDFILKFDNIEELRKAIAEKKIEELFYKGIFDIDKFFKDRLGIQLFKREEDLKDANLLIKQRNVIVHNRGRITKQYLKEFPNSTFKEGDYLIFSYEKLSQINVILNNFLVYIDDEVSSKFELELVGPAYIF